MRFQSRLRRLLRRWPQSSPLEHPGSPSHRWSWKPKNKIIGIDVTKQHDPNLPVRGSSWGCPGRSPGRRRGSRSRGRRRRPRWTSCWSSPCTPGRRNTRAEQTMLASLLVFESVFAFKFLSAPYDAVSVIFLKQIFIFSNFIHFFNVIFFTQHVLHSVVILFLQITYVKKVWLI